VVATCRDGFIDTTCPGGPVNSRSSLNSPEGEFSLRVT